MSSVMFDFKSQPDRTSNKSAVNGPIVTWELFASTQKSAGPAHPLMILGPGIAADGSAQPLPDKITGRFLNPGRQTAFRYTVARQERTADILRIDSRFVDLVTWLGENGILVQLTGGRAQLPQNSSSAEKTVETVSEAAGTIEASETAAQVADTIKTAGTAEVAGTTRTAAAASAFGVWHISEVDATGTDKLSADDGFLQFVIGRLLQSEIEKEDENTRDDDAMRLTSMQSISDFLSSASGTLPANIRSWARRNLSVARSNEVSPEERRHAQHALSIMLNIQWKSTYFAPIDPVEARRILDEELYGMASVKQRIIETIIQINRTHTLPAYGLLLCGPAGTGKSQVAYAVARILRLPWTSLDMSSIHDSEALTGSSRVYANAKPGSIMEAFYMAGQSNLVFIINELDKAQPGTSGGNPADALLTLLDGFGFTDNYMECTIPTGGVYPVATANDKSRISEPLMTRFAVIDIPDYTHEEKKVIFSRFALPKVLKRMGMKRGECTVTDEAVDVIVNRYADQPGVRDLEQAAEHLAANALYRIETGEQGGVVFDAEQTRLILN